MRSKKNKFHFLIKARDVFDELSRPLSALLIRNKENIRAATTALVALSLVFLFFPVLQKKLGSLSWALLLAILFLSPLAKISQSKTLQTLMLFRREAGILMGVFAIEHSLLYFIKFNFPLASFLEPALWVRAGNLNYIGWGSLALLLTIPLLITSNNFSMRLLKTHWKKLQRLTYLLFILVALHVVLVKYNYIQIIFIITAYIILKLLAATNCKLPLSNSTAARLKP